VIIIDRALEERHSSGKPIRVGMVGAGFMGRGIALQLIRYTQGIELVAISNRNLDKAAQAFSEAGATNISSVDGLPELEDAILHGRPAVTQDPFLLNQAGPIDVIIEVTGAVAFSAEVVLSAIDNGKHVILMNAELDGTVGPILKERADKAGVVITNADGDQPGVIMNLYRFVKGIGVQPVLCGNIKGLHDPYRNPTTQEEFARKWGQKPEMVTSFADGTKVSYEQAIVANATGMRVARRGMFGFELAPNTPVQEAVNVFPLEELEEGPGIVDYVVGAMPNPGVFVLGMQGDPIQKHYLNLYKLGEGPLYCFYTPYHLCHFEVPNTIARAVIFGDATIAPQGPPRVDVVTAAKVDLAQGDVLDGIGYYKTYGLAENADITARERLLPIGLAEGARLLRDVAKDDVLTYDDVEMPPIRTVDRLRSEQDETFFASFPKGP
jgi:predicted homoserine dehydrogenase-like protein